MKSFKVERINEYKGFTYVVIFNKSGHRCGYVGVQEDHPFYKLSHQELEHINVHGGINYSDFTRAEDNYPIAKEKTKWFGFDCIHSGDKIDINTALNYDLITQEEYEIFKDIYKDISYGKIRSEFYVEEQCKFMIDQFDLIHRIQPAKEKINRFERIKRWINL